ncbi:MAG: MFS transporter, partial [Thermomicrobiales bacterium]
RRRSHFQAIVLAVFSLCIALCSALVGYTAEWIIIIIAVVGGCAGPILTGGLTSLVSDIVPESDRERAYGLDNVTYTSAGIGGPSIAGFLGSMLNAGIATLTLAISAGIAALIVLKLPIARKIDAAHPPLRFSSVFSLRGISPLWTSRTLRGVTIASTIGTAGTAAVPLAVVLLSEHMYSSSMVGFFLTAFALGGLTGSLLYAHHPFGTSNTDFG